MSTRAAALADEFERTNAAVIQAVERMSDADWKKTCADEGWSVGVTARHVAVSHGGISSFIRMVADGQPLPPGLLAPLDELNATHAREHAGCTREEVLGLLRSEGKKTAEFLRGLSDEQLDRSQPIEFANGAPMTTEQLIRGAQLQHPADHLNSITAVAG